MRDMLERLEMKVEEERGKFCALRYPLSGRTYGLTMT
jgi:hypothetical protein